MEISSKEETLTLQYNQIQAETMKFPPNGWKALQCKKGLIFSRDIYTGHCNFSAWSLEGVVSLRLRPSLLHSSGTIHQRTRSHHDTKHTGVLIVYMPALELWFMLLSVLPSVPFFYAFLSSLFCSPLSSLPSLYLPNLDVLRYSVLWLTSTCIPILYEPWRPP